MLSTAHVAAAGVLAVAVFATAAAGPQAMAAEPKCLNKANKYVACTNKLRANPTRKSAKGGHIEVESYQWGSK